MPDVPKSLATAAQKDRELIRLRSAVARKRDATAVAVRAYDGARKGFGK